jgi:hypothetical protein
MLTIVSGQRGKCPVFEVSPSVPIGRAIDDLVLIVECSLEGDWEG